ncbi:MAG: hypothetical protein ABIJ47_07315, partial [Candidatus Bathyarchaeota archaeon]
ETPYSTAAEVRRVIHTSLTDVDIETIIQFSDADIDKRLGPQEGSDPLIKKLSVIMTAYTIRLRQPASSAIGEYSENSGNLLEVLRSEIDRITRLYSKKVIASSSYSVINEEERYKVDG